MKAKIVPLLLAKATLLLAILVCVTSSWADDTLKPKDAQQRSYQIAKRWRKSVGLTHEISNTQRAHPYVLSAFRSVVAESSKSTVAIYSGKKKIAMGAIVDSNGYILTKASELTGTLQCRFADGKQLPAKIVGIEKKHDLAMLKVNASGLPVLQWSQSNAPPVGTLLATTGLGKLPTAIGMVSVAPRKIAAPRGILGISLINDQQGPRIDQVMAGSGAEKAGLQVNDIVLGVNGQEVANRRELIRLISKNHPGDKIKVSFRRGDQKLEVTAVLGNDMPFHSRNRKQFQNTLGGLLSKRRTDFSSVLQHDTVLKPSDCGGPIVDLDGKAVGINIARAGRVSSYALPAYVVRPLMKDLMSGKLAPPSEIPQQISFLNQYLKRQENKEGLLSKQIASLEKSLLAAKQAETDSTDGQQPDSDLLKKAHQQQSATAQAIQQAKNQLKSTRNKIKQAEAKRATLSQKTS